MLVVVAVQHNDDCTIHTCTYIPYNIHLTPPPVPPSTPLTYTLLPTSKPLKQNPHTHPLTQELWPGNYNPTPTHYFMRLLHEKELLLRCYTQNIDSLEAQAGLPITAVVAAHGNFDGAHCVRCRKQHDVERVKQAALEGVPLECGGKCKGIVKPEIVFFGEAYVVFVGPGGGMMMCMYVPTITHHTHTPLSLSHTHTSHTHTSLLPSPPTQITTYIIPPYGQIPTTMLYHTTNNIHKSTMWSNTIPPTGCQSVFTRMFPLISVVLTYS